jgi:hypothetical protein
MKNQDWKIKYQDLKLRFHDCLDTSFRLGYEAGAQQAQVQQAAQQTADAQAAQQAAAMGQQPGQPGQDPNAPGQEDPNAQMQPGQDGSELDGHIQTLESMLQKTEVGSLEYMNFKKSLDGIKSFQSSLKQSYDLKKAEQAIKAIGKAIKSPFTLSKAATKNLSEPAKAALNDQEKIVNDLMKSFEEEERKASEQIKKTLNFEQLLKG